MNNNDIAEELAAAAEGLATAQYACLTLADGTEPVEVARAAYNEVLARFAEGASEVKDSLEGEITVTCKEILHELGGGMLTAIAKDVGTVELSDGRTATVKLMIEVV